MLDYVAGISGLMLCMINLEARIRRSLHILSLFRALAAVVLGARISYSERSRFCF